MGMSAGGGGAKAVPYINVTPLIDVLLVLLIIFMVVTPLKPKRFRTLIPEQQQNAPQDATPSKLTLGTDIIEKTVFIKAPESFKYGEVVKVIDAVKGAGATPVGLQVDALEP